MLATDTFVRLCRARDLLREVHDSPLTIAGSRARGRHVAVSLHPALRRAVRRDAAPVPHPGAARSREASARAWRATRSPTSAWTSASRASAASASLRAPRGRTAVRVPAPRAPDGRRSPAPLAAAAVSRLPVADGRRLSQLSRSTAPAFRQTRRSCESSSRASWSTIRTRR